MILTDIGEVGIHYEGRDFVLRPSLYAMSRLGTPREVVELFSYVMGASVSVNAVAGILWECTDEDLSDLTGYFDGEKWVSGVMPEDDIVHLARCLMKHGIVGDVTVTERRGEEPKYVNEFNAKEHVALAMAHLGLPEREAWGLTMTSLAGALIAKFPLPESNEPGAKAPSSEEHAATMDWFEKVQAMRGEKVH